ncbi:phage tail fiber protein [Ectopseudomonas oleovorans]|uniref:Phage tail fiber protein n=1 Tax=Ectopseudomonas oleovorans TaxID=301 RepID=A0AA42QB88_ECTOL|nr:phage tail fiber protein [Pseudomonas oleovorans]MDH1340567.1 phage tail fiber protein [Pseudomonas oleovorans]MDH1491539.1 phage tail fiber protein [Pseudomonas oleovorans]WGG22414.1 phage tail fiber protein [Pseudomonas oleovorans]
MAITTIYTYPLNGTQKDFNIPFEYLARRFVVLTLIGADRRELALTTDYRFTSKTTIQTNVAWGPAGGYERIEIRRNTSATDRLVDFADGSILRASEMNTAQVQTLHVAEEARNMVADTISENSDGDLDARGRRLVNLADATEPGHAVTLRQEQAWSASALNQANRAQSEADRAAGQANTATTKASAASTSEANALSYRNTAEAHKNAAYGSESNAWTYQNNALSYRNTAEAHKNAAYGSESNAWTYQNNALSYKDAAAASAAQAAGYAAGVNMPSAAGQAGRMLAQKADNTGLEYIAPYTAYGIGRYSVLFPSDNPDNPNTVNGFYEINTWNGPGGIGWYRFIHERHSNNAGYATQLCFGPFEKAGVNRMYMRTCVQGLWTSWREFWHSGNFNPANYQLALGYTPVRSDTWSGSFNHIGYHPSYGCIVAQTDETFWGRVWTDNHAMGTLASFSGTGAVGTYAFLRNATGGTVNPDTLYGGSSLVYSSSNSSNGSLTATGTWRCMGNATSGAVTLFMRVS